MTRRSCVAGQLPSTFTQLHKTQVARFSLCVGTWHYIHILQLLANHPLDNIEAIIVQYLLRGELDAAVMTPSARQLSHGNIPSFSDNASPLNLPATSVRPTDLAQLDRPLSGVPHEKWTGS